MALALLAADPRGAPAPAAADDLPSAFRGPGAVADPSRDPGTTPFSVLGGPETLVLVGGGVDYALLSADGTGEVGRGDVVWHPRGDLDCSPSATPFGTAGTDLEITVESDFPVAGTATGRSRRQASTAIGPAAAGAARAAISPGARAPSSCPAGTTAWYASRSARDVRRGRATKPAARAGAGFAAFRIATRFARIW